MSNFLRSLFGPKKSISKSKHRMQTRRLELLDLEDRITPATVSVSGTDVLITLGAGENISDLNTSTATAVITVNTFGSANNTLVGTPTGVSFTNNTVVINTAAFTTFTGIQVLGSNTTNAVTVGAAGIDLSAVTTANTNQTVAINLSFNSGTGTLNVNGPIQPKNAGNVGLNSTTVTIAGLGDITATTGSVNITGNTITSAGDVTSTGPLTLTGTGDVSVSGLVSVASVNVKSTTGDVIFGNTVTTTGVDGFISEATLATKATKIAKAVTVGAGANALVTGNLISTADTAPEINTSGTATISITGKVDGGAATNDLKLTALNGAITIGGAVGGTAATPTLNTLTIKGNTSLLASSTVNVNTLSVGQTASTFATSVTFAEAVTVGTSLLLDTSANGTVSFAKTITATGAAASIDLGSVNGSITVTGAIIGKDGVIISSTSGLITLGTISTDQANGDITITNASGNIATSGKIGTIGNSAGITLQTTLGNIITSGEIITSGNGFDSASIRFPNNPKINIVTTLGNITTAKISTLGTAAGIAIQTTSGNITTSGEISTAGNGGGGIGAPPPANISINSVANSLVTLNSPIYTTGNSATITISVASAIINTTLITSGATNAGDINLFVNGGTMVVNQPVTAGPNGDVIFNTNAATDAITIASGANITAGDAVADFGPGIINLGANITAGTASVTGASIILDTASVNLTGAVSMKTLGTGSDITLTSVNGAQNLTLEAIDQIALTNLGQTTPLNTVTVTNSAGVIVTGNFTAANVVLTDTTGTVAFAGSTVITTSLTTAAKAYNVTFAGTTVIYGTPVFLNTGNISFAGTTSLTTGATITGGPATNVNLGGTIVSSNAFNIGAGLSNINISDNTQLILNSTIAGSTQLILNSIIAGSTFASPINLNAGSAGSFNLLGIGTLTLSANSTAGVTTGDSINVTNGTLNVTGTLGSASTITLTNGTLTSPGGTVGNLVPANGTVYPVGTLNTGVVTFNAATIYLANVLSTTTASNLTGNSGFNLGGSSFCFDIVASGLAVGNSFTIINNTAASTVPIVGTFAGLPEGTTLYALDSLGNKIIFAISYVGGIGANDVTVTVTNVSIANPSAIPQPMVPGQPLLNFFTAEGAGAGGGPMVTVTIDIIPGLTTVPTYFSFFAYDVGFTGGVRVAINELDGNDDNFEIITGPGPGGGPNVKVFQFNIRTLTFNPTPVTSFFAFNDPTFNGGVYVAGGDVTGDGIGDLLVGAGAGGGPRVQVYAGSVNGVITSAPISDFFSYSTAFTGGVVVAAGDRTGDNICEVITGPASNGGYNIKSFNINSSGSNPTLIENFFAFNDFTSIGGLSIATSYFDANPMFDLVVGTTNTQFGVILNQDYAGILANPFPGFTGAIRAGFASGSNQSALAAAGPGGGPAISVFSVDPINRTLTMTDSLFVFDPAFTGGLFVAN